MFALENCANDKRRRHRNQQWGENQLQTQETTSATAKLNAKAAATLEVEAAITFVSQNHRQTSRVKSTSTTQTDKHNRLQSILSRGNAMKSIKNLLLISDTTTKATIASLATAATTFYSSLSSCLSATIGGKTISRNLWRTTRKTRDTTTTTTTTSTSSATSLWPYGSITRRRRHNCVAAAKETSIGDNSNNNHYGVNSNDNNDDDRPCQSLRHGNHRRHFLLTLMLLLVVCIVNTSSVKAADSLTGK